MHFTKLKSLTLRLELGFPRIDLAEDVADDPGMLPQPLDSLTFYFEIWAAGDLRLIKEILSSFSHVKRLSFDMFAVYSYVELLEIFSDKFFHLQFRELCINTKGNERGPSSSTCGFAV